MEKRFVYLVKGTAFGTKAAKWNAGRPQYSRSFEYRVLAGSLSSALSQVTSSEEGKAFWEDVGYHKSEDKQVDWVGEVVFSDAQLITEVGLW